MPVKLGKVNKSAMIPHPSYYRLGNNDQPRPTWVLFTEASVPNRPRSKALPPVINQLLGPSDVGALTVKPQYRHLCCSKCGRYDAYDVFDVGFDDDVKIRMKWDFGLTNDRVLLISEKFRQALKTCKTRGYVTKPVGKDGWHALKITCLVEARDEVMTAHGSNCPECGRPEDAWGMYERLSDITLPSGSNTLFTHVKAWPTAFVDRDIFMTDEVVKALKEAHLKGQTCTRLFTDEEWNKREEGRYKGVDRQPPGTIISLG